GLKLRVLDDGKTFALESNSNIISDAVAQAAQESASTLGLKTTPFLSYLANSMSLRDRTVPYSLVTAINNETFMELARTGHSVIDQYTGRSCFAINEWTARELKADLEDIVTLEYYVWQEGGRLETRREEFAVCSIVPITGVAADRNLVPDYP